MKIDLHTHSAHSDGRHRPAELVALAKAAGVGILALTDHDSTEGIAEAVEAGRRSGVEVVPGIEVSSRFEGRDVHVLGIGIDIGSRPFQERLEGMRASRRERVSKICDSLGKLGMKLSPDLVLAEAGGKSVGRKHVARAMVKAGLVGREQEAFDRYLASGRPANVPPNDLTPADAARLIRLAGGVAVLAHPGFLDDDAVVERILDSAPLRGIEVFHRYDSDVKHLRYAGLARRRDLLMTGGSDFHGDDTSPDGGLGAFTTPPEEWRKLAGLLGRS